MRNPFWAVSVLIACAGLVSAYPSGSRVPFGNSGEPGTGTPCASCHSVSLNPSGGSVKIALPGSTTFSPGETQRWTVTIADPNSSYRKGFQLTATAGKLAAVTNAGASATSSGRAYAYHAVSATTYTMDWTAPTDADSVTVYFAGAAANTTRQTNVYTASVTLTKASAKPAISAAGVVNAASNSPGISSGAWVSIAGSNLAPDGAAGPARSSGIVDGKLPTELAGVRVRINGNYAPLAYVSATQLIVQAPDDAALGPVTVDVTTTAGTSDAAAAELKVAAPGLFRFSPLNMRYVAASYADGSVAAPSGLSDSGIAGRPPKPGDTVLLFGTGFGPTNPAAPSGVVFSGAAPLAAGNNLAIRIGGVPVQVTFAGLVAAGLYQFNVVTPALADGDYLVEASVWGQDVPAQQYLAIKQ